MPSDVLKVPSSVEDTLREVSKIKELVTDAV
jgi:hypothetical protein